ncbi:MAG: PqqD family protein [Prevotellaceae bacterium]|jgi:hypothetical protein|nr:PqqD family protein [Prevotellaceae bacterium]
MKIKKEFILHQVGDEHIVIRSGASNVDFSRVISLNDTAAYLWKQVEGLDFTAETLVDLLTEEYEVTPETALRDAEELMDAWQAEGLAD